MNMFSPGKRMEGERLILLLAGRGEMVWKLKAGAGCPWQGTRLSREQRCLNKGSDHRFAYRTAKQKIGSAAYQHLERLTCESKCLSPAGPCLAYSTNEITDLYQFPFFSRCIGLLIGVVDFAINLMNELLSLVMHYKVNCPLLGVQSQAW